jgi:hypothetical protein
MNDEQTTHTCTQRLLESAGKEGVYYVVKFPTAWRLYTFPWDEFGDLWHGDVWRRFVIADLAEAWAPHLKLEVANLQKQLEPWAKGFPRGRVERADTLEYIVFHAGDLEGTGITPQRIERAFELFNSKVCWSLDSHEKRQPEHQLAIERILGLSC